MTVNKIMTANTGHLMLFPSTTSVSTSIPGISATAVAGNITTAKVSVRKVRPSDIESAVYAHIQAVRALGKTKVTPEEIAHALGLSVSAVEATLDALKSKGVKSLHAS